MNKKQQKYISDYFDKKYCSLVLTPLAVDESRPFPLLANKSLNIAVRLKGEDEESCFALVQVPSILSRFLELPSDEGRAFVLLENIIIYKIEELF